jgi:hypothetical protein
LSYCPSPFHCVGYYWEDLTNCLLGLTLNLDLADLCHLST